MNDPDASTSSGARTAAFVVAGALGTDPAAQGWKTVLSVALLGAVVGLTGCDLQPALSTPDGQRDTCRPATRVYATAPSVVEVKRELLEVPGVAHVHVLWKHSKHGRTPVSLRASTHERIGMPMLRRLPNGDWTVRERMLCM